MNNLNKIITKQDLEIITETVEVYSTTHNKATKYTDKASAIYESITHNECPICSKLKRKYYSYCDYCSNRIKAENYNKKPLLTEWDYPVYSDRFDKYFYDIDELYEYIEEQELSIKDCLLYPTKINTLPELDYGDLYTDEDYELPENIQLLLEQLNTIAKDIVISYSPNYKYRIEIND